MSSSRVLPCLFAGLVLSSACTGSAEPVSGAAGDVSEQAPGELAFVEETPLPTVLRIGLDGGVPDGIAGFDPLEVVASDQGAVIVSDLLFDGLTEVDGRRERLRPGLAVSWSANEDYTEWQFLLEPDRVTAEEVKVSLERVIAAEGLAASMLGDVSGVNNRRAGSTGSVEGFEVVDDGSLVVHLDRPNAGLPWILSGLPFSIVGPEVAPTGRFGLQESNGVADGEDEVLVLESSDGLVEIGWFGTNGEGLGLLRNDSVDVALIDDTSRGSALGAGTGEAVLGGSRFFVLNAASTEFGDQLKREAVVALVDRRELGVGSSEVQDEADGVASSGLAGFEPGGCVWCRPSEDRVRDLAQVVPTVGPLVVGHLDGDQAEVAEALVAQLVELGFRAESVELGPRELAEAVADGSVDLFGFGWASPVGSLDGVIGPLFGSTSPTNVFGLGWSEVDGLLEEAALTGDDDKRWALLREAESEALSQFVAIPYGVAVSRLVGADGVDGLVVRSDGSLDLAGVG